MKGKAIISILCLLTGGILHARGSVATHINGLRDSIGQGIGVIGQAVSNFTHFGARAPLSEEMFVNNQFDEYKDRYMPRAPMEDRRYFLFESHDYLERRLSSLKYSLIYSITPPDGEIAFLSDSSPYRGHMYTNRGVKKITRKPKGFGFMFVFPSSHETLQNTLDGIYTLEKKDAISWDSTMITQNEYKEIQTEELWNAQAFSTIMSLEVSEAISQKALGLPAYKNQMLESFDSLRALYTYRIGEVQNFLEGIRFLINELYENTDNTKKHDIEQKMKINKHIFELMVENGNAQIKGLADTIESHLVNLSKLSPSSENLLKLPSNYKEIENMCSRISHLLTAQQKANGRIDNTHIIYHTVSDLTENISEMIANFFKIISYDISEIADTSVRSGTGSSVRSAEELSRQDAKAHEYMQILNREITRLNTFKSYARHCVSMQGHLVHRISRDLSSSNVLIYHVHSRVPPISTPSTPSAPTTARTAPPQQRRVQTQEEIALNAFDQAFIHPLRGEHDSKRKEKAIKAVDQIISILNSQIENAKKTKKSSILSLEHGALMNSKAQKHLLSSIALEQSAQAQRKQELLRLDAKKSALLQVIEEITRREKNITEYLDTVQSKQKQEDVEHQKKLAELSLSIDAKAKRIAQIANEEKTVESAIKKTSQKNAETQKSLDAKKTNLSSLEASLRKKESENSKKLQEVKKANEKMRAEIKGMEKKLKDSEKEGKEASAKTEKAKGSLKARLGNLQKISDLQKPLQALQKTLAPLKDGKDPKTDPKDLAIPRLTTFICDIEKDASPNYSHKLCSTLKSMGGEAGHKNVLQSLDDLQACKKDTEAGALVKNNKLLETKLQEAENSIKLLQKSLNALTTSASAAKGELKDLKQAGADMAQKKSLDFGLQKAQLFKIRDEMVAQAEKMPFGFKKALNVRSIKSIKQSEAAKTVAAKLNAFLAEFLEAAEAARKQLSEKKSTVKTCEVRVSSLIKSYEDKIAASTTTTKKPTTTSTTTTEKPTTTSTTTTTEKPTTTSTTTTTEKPTTTSTTTTTEKPTTTSTTTTTEKPTTTSTTTTKKQEIATNKMRASEKVVKVNPAKSNPVVTQDNADELFGPEEYPIVVDKTKPQPTQEEKAPDFDLNRLYKSRKNSTAKGEFNPEVAVAPPNPTQTLPENEPIDSSNKTFWDMFSPFDLPDTRPIYIAQNSSNLAPEDVPKTDLVQNFTPDNSDDDSSVFSEERYPTVHEKK
ncbi:uncharacterized protein NEMAJ01_0669 [Nematocida major]|uniref:uncharacterized protein n=1 Tax=Nematocida major TaxID=1912982 RepID=UPI002007DB4D|nr:uncharacterized protein NEMAJ01_0669 [Nematocida major]KAH9385773.1 hypothetical protein NEMAJ01_0669 [Nematocida major]